MTAAPEQSFVRKLLERSQPWVAAAVVLLIWEIAVRALQIRHSILPSPTRVLLEIGREAPQLRKHALITGFEALHGLLLAMMLGLLLMVLATLSTRFCLAVKPVLLFLHKLPWVTLAPLMIIWFGYGSIPAAALAFLACFLPLVGNIQAGLDSVSVETVEIVKMMGAGSGKIFMKIRLPACLPFATNGLKISIPLALSGASVAEFIGSDKGLGYLMLDASSKMNTTQLLAALAVLLFLALGSCFLIRLVERIWISWPAAIPAWADLGQLGGLRHSHPGRTN